MSALEDLAGLEVLRKEASRSSLGQLIVTEALGWFPILMFLLLPRKHGYTLGRAWKTEVSVPGSAWSLTVDPQRSQRTQLCKLLPCPCRALPGCLQHKHRRCKGCVSCVNAFGLFVLLFKDRALLSFPDWPQMRESSCLSLFSARIIGA